MKLVVAASRFKDFVLAEAEAIKAIDHLFKQGQINLKQLASILFIHPATVRYWVREGVLNPVKVGRDLSLNFGEVEKVIKEGISKKVLSKASASKIEAPSISKIYFTTLLNKER